MAFDQPQASGGAAPVTTTCTPQSGTQFTVGSTIVACQARDASSQVASCGFSVAVQATPQLQAARFLAFGDSTDRFEGQVSVRPETGSGLMDGPPHADADINASAINPRRLPSLLKW